MSDIPFDNPDVAGVVIRCLQECDRALNVALVETQPMMSTDDWKMLRLGVGHIVGSDMLDLWVAIVKKHPQFESAFAGLPGEGGGACA
ncbi:hypothetical protein [Tardiphaga sp.]|uniref:hypothetical protein n=1 Tax=Tardiphaga sp. TaxID=1926292 RepID=UPI0025E1F15C|nr:hypothetical protein [Tardiphaga sp.]